MFIYKITNAINSKSYIGKTITSLDDRFKKHLRCAEKKINRYLYDAMNYHGSNNFNISIIEKCDNIETLNLREIFWIKELQTLSPHGYNMTLGGDGGNTLIGWSDEAKNELWKRQAESRVGQKRTTEQRKRISESKIGIELSQQHRAAISQTLCTKYKSGELIANVPIFYGEQHHNYLAVDIEEVLSLIHQCKTLSEISKIINVSTYGIRKRLVEKTGKTYLEWRKEYAIIGKLSEPSRTD